MGFRQAAVLCCTCFFLGVLSICLSVDYRLLYQELTKEAIDDGFLFYTTFFNAPPAIKGLLHGLVGFGVLAFVAKLYKWDDSAFFFDGTGLGTYTHSQTSPIRPITDPLDNSIRLKFKQPPISAPLPFMPLSRFPRYVRLWSNYDCSPWKYYYPTTLTFCFQAGQEYAKRLEEKELAKIELAEKVKAATAVVDGESKKDK